MRKIESLPFEEIKKMYLGGLGFYPIAKIFSSTYKTIRRILNLMSVPLRTRKEQSIITGKDPIRNKKISDKTKGKKKNLSESQREKISISKTKFKISKEFLIEEYIVKENSSFDIAENLECSPLTIQNNLHKYNIPTRITGRDSHTNKARQKCIEARKKQNGINHPRLGRKNSEVMRSKISNTHKERGNFVLEKNPMWGKHHSQETIRKALETKKKRGTTYIGENNPNWMGGIMFEPYDNNFNEIFKKTIKERDNYTCLRCGISNEEAKERYIQGLHIHHIDYNKINTSEENCCCLCCRCNILANYNREYWTKFFQSLLSERYGYKYSEDGRPIINIEVKNEI